MSALDYAAFALPLVFLVILYSARGHYLHHPVALVAIVLLTVVSILHFDVGMLTSDPYDALLDDIGAPKRTWTASVILLLILSYSGEVQDRLAEGRRPRRRAIRRSRLDSDP